MNTRLILTSLAFAFGLTGCGESSGATSGAPSGGKSGTTSATKPSGSTKASSAPVVSGSAPTASASAAADGSISGTFASAPTKLYPRVNWNNVEFRTKKLACGEKSDKVDGFYFEMNWGPAGKYYAGKEMPGDGWVVAGDLHDPYPEFAVVANVQPFEQLKEGEKLKGTVSFDWKKGDKVFKVEGPFEAPICTTVPHDGPFWPETTAEKPAAGGKKGKVTIAKSTALVRVEHDKDNDVDYVRSIEFFGTEATCDKSDSKKGAVLFVAFGGANSRKPILGTPIQSSVTFIDDKGSDTGASGWIQLDTVDLKKGGSVTGKVFHEQKDPKKESNFSGTFTATVCGG